MKKVLGILLVLVLAFVGFVATRPNTFRVERSATVAAPSKVVFSKINDFDQWVAWSPWEKLDPNMKRTIGGPDAGVGATYEWAGNDKAGEGRMTITESQPPEKVGIRLEFIKPWEATSQATFTLTPEAGATKVNWAMDGNHNFMSKAMCVFMSMDKMVGTDFEKGLATLKALAEAEPAAPDSISTS